MKHETLYDGAFVGGGLAGLTAAIALSKLGYRVVVFEKEQYPFHKVCGEYISLESWDYLELLGLPLQQLQLPIIKKLVVSAPSGQILEQALPLGGFGISRYTLDEHLKNIALENNVVVLEQCKVEEVVFKNEAFHIQTNQGNFQSKTCCGSYGKKSNLDVKWKRPFLSQPPNKLNNYIGVKYHIQTNFPVDTIALHNFKDGYCGISKIEGDKYCMCYLTNAANLKKHLSIPVMEEKVLAQNPHLRQLFANSTRLFDAPLSISHISFDKKSTIENHVLMLGDAAGLITPLCGNGMSMAMHAGKIAVIHLDSFLQNKISRSQLETAYTRDWKTNFAGRIRVGRIIQSLFGKPALTNLFVGLMKKMPWLTRWLIGKTHGKPF